MSNLYKLRKCFWRFLTVHSKSVFFSIKTIRLHNFRHFSDPSFSGRSMIEMLGVLAIVGILSVGAISGYQKAMYKYRLNKHAQSVNTLINNALQTLGKLEALPNQYTFYGDIFNKLQLIPEGMVLENDENIYDIFHNRVSIYHANLSTSEHNAIRFSFDTSDIGAQVCQNIVTVAKENSSNLWVVNVYKQNDPDTAYGQLFGDQYCKKSNSSKCLKNLSLDDIAATCYVCDNVQNPCLLFVTWK